MEIIVYLSVDHVPQIGKHGYQLARNHPEHLVNQMNAPVVQHAAALVLVYMPVVHIAVKAVQHRFHRVHAPQRASVEHFLRNAEVLVEATLLVHGKGDAVLIAALLHGVKVRQRKRYRLFTQNMLASLRGHFGELAVLVVVSRN